MRYDFRYLLRECLGNVKEGRERDCTQGERDCALKGNLNARARDSARCGCGMTGID